MTALPDAQLTHVGLFVEDMAAMVAFYTDVLGLVVSDAGEHTGRQLTFLSRHADEHHQVVLVTGRRAERGVVQLLGQVSFRVAGLDDLRIFHRHALVCGATAMEARNHGNSWSIYFEDPEGNRIEVYCTTPWYVRQPWRVPLDLNLSNAEIEAATLTAVGSDDVECLPIDAFRSRMLDRLATRERNDG